MVAYEAYNAILSLRNASIRTELTTQMQAITNSQFQIASNYQIIKYKNRATGVFNDLGVRLSGWYSSTSADIANHDNIKKLTFQDLSTVINLGDVFEFGNFRWIATIVDNIGGITASCAVQRCNCKLKFIDSTNDVMPSTPLDTIYSVDAIADVKIYIPIEDRYVLLPSNTMTARIPNDAEGRKIKDAPKGTRFLLGNPLRAWRTVAVDTITEVYKNINDITDNGIINLKLQLDSINIRVDNVVAEIAKQYS